MSLDKSQMDDYPMSFAEVCEYLGFAQTYLHTLIRKDRIKSYQPTGRRRFFYKSDVDAFVKGEVKAEAS